MPSLFYAGQPDYIEKLNTLATAASMTNGTVAASFLSLAVTGTATAASFVGPLTGNASTATTLATARNINGVAFNGSADITVTAAAGTLTGTTLAPNVVNASLNSITPAGGTLTTTGVFRTTGSVGIGGAEQYTTAGRTSFNVNGTTDAVIGVTLNENTASAAYLIWDGTNADLNTTGTWRFLIGNVLKATLAATGAAFSGAVSAPGFTGPLTGNVTGNASTATTLATARNINGVAFNGSADITVTAAAGTLTGTTLAPNVVNASLNSITPSGDVLDVIGHVIRVGRYGSGTGGNVRFVNDAGVQHWLAGILGGVGYRRYSIYDLPNAREILGIDATSGQVQLGYGLAVTGSISATDYIAGAEQTPPSAPAANGYRIFAQDNGAGKTQLMVIFASGAAQQIAIEP